MPRSYARTKHPKTTSREDAFIEKSWAFLAWAQNNLRAVLTATVAIGLLVAGILYYRNYQATVREQAAAELQSLSGTLLRETPAVAAERLQTFIARYGNAPAAYEARLVLARVQLDLKQPDAALATLAPVLDKSSTATPLGHAARVLFAAAQEDRGDLTGAIATLRELAQNAELPFQRRRARAETARLLAATGKTQEAAAVYKRLIDEAADAKRPAEAALYRLRFGELSALPANATASESAEAPSDSSPAVGSSDTTTSP